MTDTAIVLRAVHRTFQDEGTPVRALRGADLTVSPGELVAVVGPSGSGKSTLLSIVAGLDVPTEGSVSVLGTDLAGMGDDDLGRFRSTHIGLVFQFFNLLDALTVAENVELALLAAGRRRREAAARAREVLDLLGLASRASSSPSVLSGGERQRLAVARALANEPPLVLADEPTGALDSAGAAEVLELLRRVHADGRTVVIVTHDRTVASAAERIVELRDGVVVDRAETATV